MRVGGLSTSLIPSYRTKFLRFFRKACSEGGLILQESHGNR
jgi:hypothetical protein